MEENIMENISTINREEWTEFTYKPCPLEAEALF